MSKYGVCLLGCLNVVLLFLARPPHGHLPPGGKVTLKHREPKYWENRAVPQHLTSWTNRMPSTTQTTGNRQWGCFFDSYMKKKTLNYAAWYSVADYLSVSFLWNISLLFLMLSLLYPSNCLFNETALMHTGLHFSFFSIPLATFYLPYIQLTCSPSDLSVHVSTHFYIYLLLF